MIRVHRMAVAMASLSVATGCGLAQAWFPNAVQRPLRSELSELHDHDGRAEDSSSKWMGRVPRSLQPGAGDRAKAKPDEQMHASGDPLELLGMTEGKLCFEHLVVEKTFGFSEQDVARVEELGQSYHFQVDTFESLDDKRLADRSVWTDGAGAPLVYVSSGAPRTMVRPNGDRFIGLSQKLCAELPAPAASTHLLVVSGRPGSAENDRTPYALAWELY
jgi:hypothetical protein